MKRFGAIVLVLVFVVLSTSVFAATEVLWRIGKPDRSAAEFALAGRHRDYNRDFPGGTTFEIGKGTAAKNWVYVQPGPKDEPWAGQGDHPYEVVFDLKSVPKGPMALEIGIVDTNRKDPPLLRLRVNDTSREYKLKPGSPKASLEKTSGQSQVLRMLVAPAFLRTGRNVVNIRAVDGSWLIYDYVSLVRWDKAPRLAANLSAESTLLFKKQDSGLKQVVRASVDLFEDQPVIKAHVESENGWKADQVLKNVSRGLKELDICIPPVKTTQKLRLKLQVGSEIHETTCVATPQKQWKIYLTPTSHFDYGYNLVQSDVVKLHLDNMERAIDWCGKYPDFVWDLEGSFLAQRYLAEGKRPDEFVKLAKEGRIGVQAFYDNHLTGICSGEELNQLIYEYDALRRKYGIESKFAMQTDIPDMVWTMPMMLREHGVKYISHGINFTRAFPRQDNMLTPFYWESPDGSKVLMWKVGTYGEAQEVHDVAHGDAMNMDKVHGFVRRFISRTDYPFDAILLHGGYADNAENSEALPRSAAQWNSMYEYPKFVFSRGSEFFEYIEAKFAKDIKTVKGDGGAYWEDGVGSSARETGITRVAKEKLLTAQKLIALSDIDFQKQMKSKLADAWENVLLYGEHTWGADISIQYPTAPKTIEEWEVKKGFADKAAQLADELLAEALEHVKIEASEDSLAVINPSSWTRSEYVEFAGSDGQQMSIFADSVPGMGYKVFPIKEANTLGPPESYSTGSTVENKFYKVTLDETTGAVRSIYDKELGRELVDPSSYGLNSYLYVSGATYDGILKDFYGKKDQTLKIETCSNPTFRLVATPGKRVLSVMSSAPMANGLSSRIVLYDDVKRIDFMNDLNKIETVNSEGGYFAFPFAFTNPVIRLEIPNGTITPDKDHWPGACRDWFCAQSFVSISDDKASVVWSALDSPLLTLQDINRGHWYDRLSITNGNLFAYVFNNYWFTNYKASQGGPLTFRFSMTSSKPVNDLQAKQFGESVQSPMLGKVVRGGAVGDCPQSVSLVSVEGASVVLQSIEPARFAEGTVLHLREISGVECNAQVKAGAIPFKRAHACNLAEDKLGELTVSDGAVQIPCRPFGITSILLER